MRTLTIALGAILAVYCSFGSLSQTWWPNNEAVNGVLCHFLLCDNAPLVRRARDQLAEGTSERVHQAITTFRMVLQQDSQDPYRWADLGDAFLQNGQEQDARYCFHRVLFLAPQSVNFLLRVADFYFQTGEYQEALPITARVLALTSDYDSVVFDDYIRNTNRIADVLRLGIPKSRRAAQSWLHFLIQTGRLEDAQRTWDWLVELGYADDRLAGEFVEFLIRQGYPESAASTWVHHMGAREPDYDESTYVFNGDFESEPVQSPFDWTVLHTEGVEVRRDCTTAWSGECSLRISFTGTQNLGVTAASQFSFVRPGTYRFQAYICTRVLTTDQGIRFRISDAEEPSRLDDVFGQFTGTTGWSSIKRDIVVAPNTRLVRIEVIRQTSTKFDNKVAGIAWIDHLALTPTNSQLPR